MADERRAWRGCTVVGAAMAAAATLLLCGCASMPNDPAPRSGMYGRGYNRPTQDHRLAQARPRTYNRPYEVRGRWYTPADAPGYDETGLASWYGYESGHRTSDGEAFTLEGLTAAHRTLPIPSLLEVTNLDTGARVVVRLNDRGPFVEGRLLDVSHAAAQRLGMLGHGTARVRVRYLGPATPFGSQQVARVAPPAPREDVDDGVDPLQLVATVPQARGVGGDARVQAAAFADEGLARLAADRLGDVGACSVEPLERATGVRWRVVISGAPGEQGRLIAEAAALGFPGARALAD